MPRRSSRPPHDRLIRAALRGSDDARAFLRFALPPALQCACDFESLSLVRGSFVDERLRGHFTDALFSLRLPAEDLLLYVLVEHVRSPDPHLPLQVLRYLVRILEDWSRANPSAAALPRVVAITIHQAERAYQGPMRMVDLYPGGANSPFARFGPDFEMITVDLARTDDDALRALDAPFIATALLLMKHVGAPDLSARIVAWSALLARVTAGPSPRRALVQLLTYLAEAARDERAPEAFVEVLPVTETTYETLADRLRREGRQQGRQEGRQEGRSEGARLGSLEEARRSLTRALELRFGSIDPDASQRIAAADLTRLRAWFDRAVTASSQDAVFVDA